MYELRLLEAASRELARVDAAMAKRIAKRMAWLAENVERISPEPLIGPLAGLFKLRVGDYRVLYEILRDEEVVIVHMIGHRRDVYRKR